MSVFRAVRFLKRTGGSPSRELEPKDRDVREVPEEETKHHTHTCNMRIQVYRQNRINTPT